MATFTTTRREMTIEFAVKTTAKATTYSGTAFVPNHCDAKVYGDEIVSLTLSKLDENGWGMDDPSGPDGAELHADFGGGEFLAENRAKLPKIAQDALAEVEKAIR